MSSANPYFIRMIVLEDGERLPILYRRDELQPLYFPAAYVLTKLRSRHLAASTLERELRHIASLLLFASDRGIDIDARFRRGEFLTQAEVGDFVAFAAQDTRAVLGALPREMRRNNNRRRHGVVIGAIKANRIRSVKNYLSWLAAFFVGLSDRARGDLLNDRLNEMLRFFRESTPRALRRNQLGSREGLSDGSLDRLLAVIQPNSPDNPWKNEYTKWRNYIVVLLGLLLGLRRGEILGLSVDDICLRAETLTVTRRPDDPDDRRIDQPNSKTFDRRLPLRRTFVIILRNFVNHHRPSIRGARRHKFLIAAHQRGHGKELSKSGFTRIYRDLRRLVPELPDDLTSHVGRHTAVDRFADGVDEQGITPDLEAKLRDYHFGHKPGAQSGLVYMRRRARKRAAEAALKHQAKMMEGVEIDAETSC